MLQRAEYARRFKEAEDKGLTPVLLVCGDHDPDGLRITDFIKSNLEDVANITWDDGETGWNPENLIIKRFGLNKDFIDKHKLTWIDNLYTGRGKDLGDPKHPNHNMPYLQNYLSKIGKRKLEANAIVTIPDEARKLCREAIVEFLGTDAWIRFDEKRKAVVDEFENFMVANKLKSTFDKALTLTQRYI
jgi:hypothetical protein